MKKFYFLLASFLCLTITSHAQWSLSGNAISSTNFLGTTNSQTLVFKVNSVISGYLDNNFTENTFFGIGSGNPTVSLFGNAGFGYHALAVNTSGNNTAFGALALASNTSGNENTGVGVYALNANTTGVSNTVVGPYMCINNTTGSYNCAFGSAALSSITTATGNSAFGAQALNSNTASYNSAFGYLALDLNSTGTLNSAFGHYALIGNTTGSHNVAYGDSALSVNTTGSQNTAVGDYAGPGSGSTSLTNSSAFGYGATVTASNNISIGNTSVTTISGAVGWTIYSDGRFKKNIKENVPGLEFIKLLRPITYTLDVKGLNNHLGVTRPSPVDEQAIAQKEAVIYTGFIAQEVESAAKKLSYDFSGVTPPQNEKDIYGLRYSDFVVPLVKAMQELSNTKDSLIAIIDSLKTAQNSLQSQINSIAQQLKTLKSTALSGTSPVLQQNAPNPFNSTTVINYYIPPTTNNAQLTITDGSGRILKDVVLNNSNGPGQAIISAGELASGTYFYSLVIDGKNVATRKMVLAK